MNVSLLEGKISRSILLFAVPIFFSLLLQTLYNTVDTVLVGHFLGEGPLAAMGATTALFDLIVGFCTGCGNGFGIIAGQNFGADDKAGLKKTSAASLVLTLIIAVILSVLFWACMPMLLHWLNTPEDIFADALTYIRIIVAGLIITAYYNLAAGMLRAVGDSMTPLVILAISSALNIVLDVLFILGLHMGVAGAAYATLLAQLISTAVCLVWILKKKQLLVPQKPDYKFEKHLVAELLEQGLSMGLMGSIVAIGSVILQSAINQFGTLIIAAHTAARRVYMILGMPLFALQTSLVTFVAQNFGAKQYNRIVRGIQTSSRMAIVYSIFVTILAWLCADWLIELISGSRAEEVLYNGALYLKINCPFFFALGILCNLRSSLQGLGYRIVPVVSSVIELAGKMVFTWLIIPKTGYIGVIWCEPVIWVLMMLYLDWAYMRNDTLKSKNLHPKLV